MEFESFFFLVARELGNLERNHELKLDNVNVSRHVYGVQTMNF